MRIDFAHIPDSRALNWKDSDCNPYFLHVHGRLSVFLRTLVSGIIWFIYDKIIINGVFIVKLIIGRFISISRIRYRQTDI